MIYAGIDVAKDKHDCLIVDSNGKVSVKTTIPSDRITTQKLQHKISP